MAGTAVMASTQVTSTSIKIGRTGRKRIFSLLQSGAKRSEAEHPLGDTAGGRAAGQADAVGDPTDRVECQAFTHLELKAASGPFPPPHLGAISPVSPSHKV
ncbi:hypothetical protein GCM10020255_001390 [Rhodococcus baikonurensis]